MRLTATRHWITSSSSLEELNKARHIGCDIGSRILGGVADASLCCQCKNMRNFVYGKGFTGKLLLCLDVSEDSCNKTSQQGVLVTYLIPGFVGRGVRLGSESLSVAGATRAGGVWKSKNLEIRRSVDLEIF